MIPTVNRFGHTLAVAGLTLTLVVGTAAAARPSGQAVIDDWDDNGRIDRSWSCELALDGLARDRGADRRPGNVAMQTAIERHVRGQCAARKVRNDTPAAMTSGPTRGATTRWSQRSRATPRRIVAGAAPTELSFGDTDTADQRRPAPLGHGHRRHAHGRAGRADRGGGGSATPAPAVRAEEPLSRLFLALVGTRLTERAGFEPAKRLSTLTRFPVALLRPLGHLSGRGTGYRGGASPAWTRPRTPPRSGSRSRRAGRRTTASRRRRS